MKANHLNTSPWAKGKLFSVRFFEKKKSINKRRNRLINKT